MNAEDIRKKGISWYATKENQAVVEALDEIAAQLAKQNCFLKRIAYELERQSPFV